MDENTDILTLESDTDIPEIMVINPNEEEKE